CTAVVRIGKRIRIDLFVRDMMSGRGLQVFGVHSGLTYRSRCGRIHIDTPRGGAEDMKWTIGKLAALCVTAALVLGVASTAAAQILTGRIDVAIEDSTGGRLPGVNVDITGPSSQTLVTDAQGEAHFLNLPVGVYTVKATISGFNPFTNS